ncbi:hypothetical protein SAMN04488059_1711 [Devosia psychrophila]|uniref:Uncharacterized protein n=1 Tax=Devosia psychrophila TaxID=728005 RepID=A0A1I1SJL0_9HYPH|nr:hypothetical protein SAMN04488059_1711 [Devosia psychrophila]
MPCPGQRHWQATTFGNQIVPKSYSTDGNCGLTRRSEESTPVINCWRHYSPKLADSRRGQLVQQCIQRHLLATGKSALNV